MYVYIVPKPGQADSVLRKVGSMRGVSVTASKSNKIVIRLTTSPPANQSAKTRLENRFKKINGVLHVVLVLPHLDVQNVELQEALRTNRCVLFFDIDSTLTQGGPGTIHPKISPIFEKISAYVCASVEVIGSVWFNTPKAASTRFHLSTWSGLLRQISATYSLTSAMSAGSTV